MILTLLFIVSVFCQYSIHLAFLGHSLPCRLRYAMKNASMIIDICVKS